VDENIFHLINLSKYSLVQSGDLYIQTRLNNKSFQLMLGNDLSKWTENELQNRNVSLLPPFNYILTIDYKENNFTFKPLEKFKCDKVRIGNLYRYIFYLPRDIWENDIKLRNIVVSNLREMNLKINPRSIFR
jgi:hypothetical protein